MDETEKQTTLLIKSFLRKECVEALVSSIRKYYKNIKIVIVDDSDLVFNFNDINIDIYNIKFDSGISVGRNYGIDRINTKYFVLLDDDFVFTSDTKIHLLYQTIESSDLDILGGAVIENSRYLSYNGNFFINEENNTLELRKLNLQKEVLTVCDIIPNFFIAKTEKIKEIRWDDCLKVAEHAAFFYKCKGRAKVGYTNIASINHCQKSNKNYHEYRKRSMEYFKIWLNKLPFSGFVDINSEKYKV